MEDRIQEITSKIYEEGVLQAREEAERILNETQKKADEALAEAHKKGDQIVESAKIKAGELEHNVREEIKYASHQAINSVKQKIADIITLKVTEEPLKELLDDKTYVAGLVTQVMQHWEKSAGSEDFQLVFPAKMEKETNSIVLKKIHEQFGNNMKIDFSHKLENGFRISPAGYNYLISFSEEDFSLFFKQFLRPKTIQLLYNEDQS
ncbi:MAG: hypothetical protein IPL55_18450 [Saprospiraceae bacterium]|jgi:V/A-type H+-transporting ATPase subunit E|nr:hypothetical protein [Saprospiraceae bacterium]